MGVCAEARAGGSGGLASCPCETERPALLVWAQVEGPPEVTAWTRPSMPSWEHTACHLQLLAVGRVCSLLRPQSTRCRSPGGGPLRAWRALVPVSGAGVLAAVSASGPHCSLTERPVLPSPKLFMTSRRP